MAWQRRNREGERTVTAGDKLIASGADVRLVVAHEHEVTESLLSEHERRILAMGRHLVSRGLSDEWPDLFRIAFPDATQSDPLEWLQTGEFA